MNKIYVLILNYNSARDSLELYSQLEDLNLRNIKVFVIDNASKPGDIQKLTSQIPVENLILNDKNLGYAGGNNIGIKKALKEDADFIWLLNPDIRIEKETLPCLLETILSDNNIAAVGPRICSRLNENEIFSDGGVVLYNPQCYTYLINYDQFVNDHNTSVNFNISYVDGSSILINSLAIKNIGDLPIEYFLYFEETDWCARAKKLGWKLAINTHAKVYNLKSEKNYSYVYYMMRNRLIFAKKYHPTYKKVYFYYIKLLLKESFFHITGYKKRSYLKWELKGLFDAFKIIK